LVWSWEDGKNPYNEQLYNLYSSPDNIRMLKEYETGCVAYMREDKKCMQNFD
jgi:hypothetical protein